MNALIAPSSLGCNGQPCRCGMAGMGDAACPTAQELADERRRRATVEAQALKRTNEVAALRAEITQLQQAIAAARARRATPAPSQGASPAPASPAAADPNCPTPAQLDAERQLRATVEAQVQKRTNEVAALQAEIAQLQQRIAAAANDPNCPTMAQLDAERQRRATVEAQANKRADEVIALNAEIADLQRQIGEWRQRNNAKYRDQNAILRRQIEDQAKDTQNQQTRILATAIDQSNNADELRTARSLTPAASPAPIVVNSGPSTPASIQAKPSSGGLIAVGGLVLLLALGKKRKGGKGKRR